MSITIKVIGRIKEDIGFSYMELEIEDMTIEEMLRSVKTKSEGSLFDFLFDEGKIKDSFMLLVNGTNAHSYDRIRMRVNNGDVLLIMNSAPVGVFGG